VPVFKNNQRKSNGAGNLSRVRESQRVSGPVPKSRYLHRAVPSRATERRRVGGACLPTGASRGGTQARCLKRQLSLPVSSPTRVPRNTGFPPMTLPFNRSLVGARVKRISSARAPEMCPFSKTIRENQTVRETFQGFANPTGQRPGAQVPVPPQLPCVRCWRWPRRCWRARSPIAAASTTRPSTVFRVGPPCSGQQRTGTPALGKPRKRCPSDGGPRVRIHFPPAASQANSGVVITRPTKAGPARRIAGTFQRAWV
jgi:hypothetical protein